jgi:hypothetical protein
MLYAGGLVSLLLFAFVLYCVLDVVLSEPVLVRNLPKLVWLVLVLLVPLIGGIAWLVAGRPATAGGAPGSRVSRVPRGRPRPRPPAPRGPEDDPDFLRDLTDRLRPPDQDP